MVLPEKKPIPVEVKYRENPTDIKGLLEFTNKFDVKQGFVVTKDLLDKQIINGKEILFIPTWIFLLVL